VNLRFCKLLRLLAIYCVCNLKPLREIQIMSHILVYFTHAAVIVFGALTALWAISPLSYFAGSPSHHMGFAPDALPWEAQSRPRRRQALYPYANPRSEDRHERNELAAARALHDFLWARPAHYDCQDMAGFPLKSWPLGLAQ